MPATSRCLANLYISFSRLIRPNWGTHGPWHRLKLSLPTVLSRKSTRFAPASNPTLVCICFPTTFALLGQQAHSCAHRRSPVGEKCSDLCVIPVVPQTFNHNTVLPIALQYLGRDFLDKSYKFFAWSFSSSLLRTLTLPRE